MTKKDYELIARVLNKSRPRKGDLSYSGRIYQWEKILNIFIEELSKENKRFDEDKFKGACGYYNSI